MDVIDDPDGGAFARDRLEHSSVGPKDFRKAQLLAREPDGRGDSIRDLSLPDQASKLRDALFGRVLRSDPRGATRRFDQRPERDALAVGQAAAAEDQRGRIARVDELADQPALAAARVGDDRRHPSPSLVEGAQQDLAQGGHLRLTPDHGRVLAPPEALDRLRDREKAIRRTVLGLPFNTNRTTGPDVTRIRTKPRGKPPDQHPRGGAACSRRAATLTASPVTSRWPRLASPVITSPVFTPTWLWIVIPERASSSALSCAMAACISMAALDARRASSSWRIGSPKTAITASPMNFSTEPPCFSRMGRMRSK